MKGKLAFNEKVELIERYLNTGKTPESITKKTIFEGYDIGEMLILIRYGIKNGRFANNKDEIEKLEDMGVLQKRKEPIKHKVERLVKFCHNNLEFWIIRYDEKKLSEYLSRIENNKEKVQLLHELEIAKKDYMELGDVKSRDFKHGTKRLSDEDLEELRKSGVGGVFGYPNEINEMIEKSKVENPKIRKRISEFLLLQMAIYGSLETFINDYIEKTIQGEKIKMPKELEQFAVQRIDLSNPNFINLPYSRLIGELEERKNVKKPLILFNGKNIDDAFECLTSKQRDIMKVLYGTTDKYKDKSRQNIFGVKVTAMERLEKHEKADAILRNYYDDETVRNFLKRFIEIQGVFVNPKKQLSRDLRVELLDMIQEKAIEAPEVEIDDVSDIDETIKIVLDKI